MCVPGADVCALELARAAARRVCVERRANITRFLDIAQELGLNVVLRPGPYVCAEVRRALAMRCGLGHSYKAMSSAATGVAQSQQTICFDTGPEHDCCQGLAFICCY